MTVFAKVTLEEFLLHRISLCEKEKLLKGRHEIVEFKQASLVQLVERRSPKPDVVGSSPTGRVEKIKGSCILAI